MEQKTKGYSFYLHDEDMRPTAGILVWEGDAFRIVQAPPGVTPGVGSRLTDNFIPENASPKEPMPDNSHDQTSVCHHSVTDPN